MRRSHDVRHFVEHVACVPAEARGALTWTREGLESPAPRRADARRSDMPSEPHDVLSAKKPLPEPEPASSASDSAAAVASARGLAPGDRRRRGHDGGANRRAWRWPRAAIREEARGGRLAARRSASGARRR